MKTCTEMKHVWRRGLTASRCKCGKVQRCCASIREVSYNTGRRCRRRSVEGSSWCTKHAWIEDQIQAIHKAGRTG